MSNQIHYADSEEYTPLSPWAHVGYSIVYAIPIIGFLFLIIYPGILVLAAHRRHSGGFTDRRRDNFDY